MLARRLLNGPFGLGGGPSADVGELVLADLAEPRADLPADPRVRAVTGDLQDVLSQIDEADVIFHLAGVVSGAAEADFDLGMRVNVDGTRALLEQRPLPSGTAGVRVLQLAGRIRQRSHGEPGRHRG
jgi:nucleoside-diphosphate-sugar epimerase